MNRPEKIRFPELLKIALSSLSTHKLRTGLTLLGVIIAVSTLILVVSVLKGMDNYINERVRNMGANVFFITKIPPNLNFEERMKAWGRNKDLTMDDLRALSQNARLLNKVGASVNDLMELKYKGQTQYDVIVDGVTDSMINLNGIEVEEGRYVDQFDVEHSRNVCFIGKDAAENLFPRMTPLGKEIRIKGIPFEVIGLAKKIGSSIGESQDNFVNIPISTFQKHFSSRRSIIIWARADSPAQIDEAMDEVRVMMRARHHLKYTDKDDFGIAGAAALNDLWNKLMGGVSIASYWVTAVFLIVGGIVIMNIMLAVVTERTREIGIRKSLGARRRDILVQYLIESITMSTIGGLIGVIIAFLGTRVVTMPTGTPAEFSIWAVVLALVVSGGVGLFFGLYPANQAAKLDPIVALRSE